MEITDKPLPKNIKAEEKILGCLITNSSLLTTIDSLISELDFYSSQHRAIYGTIKFMINAKIPISSITIIEELKKQRLDKKIGGIEFIERLQKNISDTDIDSVSYYASVVKEKSEKRKLYLQGKKIEIEALTSTKPAKEILKVLQQDILLLSDKTIKKKWDIKESLNKVYNYLDVFSKDHKGVISTGWEEIDDVLKGIKKKRVYLIGGLPGIGKTSFLIALARNILLQHRKVLYFTLEMTQDEILLRLLQGVANVPNHKIEAPKDMTGDEWGRLAGAINEVSEWPLIVCDGSYDTNQFEMEIKDHNPDVVIIDHIDCMPFYGEHSDTPFFLANIVVKFTQMVKENNVALIFASQLKESAEKKKIYDYDVQDYAGSRGKGRTVPVGMFISWPNKNEYLFLWKVAKNRFGRIGTGKLYFKPAFGIYEKWED